MNQAIIGLGSNIDPAANIQKARDLLGQEFSVLKESEFVQTKPVGYTEQADFLNGAVLLETELDPDVLRESLKAIESSLGRTVSPIKFGPRTIDLDIVVWNGKVIDQDFYTRSFIKKSVMELIPSLEY